MLLESIYAQDGTSYPTADDQSVYDEILQKFDQAKSQRREDLADEIMETVLDDAIARFDAAFQQIRRKRHLIPR